MKKLRIHITKTLCYLALLCGLPATAGAQTSGRVVINEYMPWTLNGCGATAEFVELLNFGPGPMNIGCYILTDGDYSVTIPANTILQPGEFYLIAGQNMIPSPCANIDSAVNADLNWNTCGCTSAPIPTSGDGFFTDGGSANEQVVLLDPSLKIVDAVIRGLPAESSAPITTGGAGCSPRTFNLDTMAVDYEVLGMSAGRGNSFARKLDGDCGWVKDPQQSGNATNNAPGETSSVRYDFSIVRSMDCDSTHGSIDLFVNVGSEPDVFPMNYTIAFDSNGDGYFTLSDTYTYGVDSTPPRIEIQGLPLGRYRVTVSSSKGCFLQTFEFSILDCTAVLDAQPLYLNLSSTANNRYTFEWVLPETKDIGEIVLEGNRGALWEPVSRIALIGMSGRKHFTQVVSSDLLYTHYRLRLVDRNGKSSYSVVLTVSPAATQRGPFPNPAREKLSVPFRGTTPGTGIYRLYHLSGKVIAENAVPVQPGANILNLHLAGLLPGMYYLQVTLPGQEQPIQFRFVKH